MLRVRIDGVVERFLLGDYTTIDVRAARGNDRIEIGDLSAAGHPKSLIVDAGDGDDDVIGSPYADRLSGGRGNDSIRGGGGNDTLHGDAGDDVLKGDDGDDQINGDDGADVLSDNGGVRNLLKGGSGNDRLTFESRGLVSTGSGYGGAGDDQLRAAFSEINMAPQYNGASAPLYGDAGNDRLEGWSLHGGEGNDRLARLKASSSYASFDAWGDGGNDTIAGTNPDRTRYSSYSGLVYGGGGDDQIVAEGNVDGGSGNDRITAVTSNTPSSVNGGAGNDLIQGSDGPNLLFGDDGNDTIRASDGNDTLYGGSGDDELRGQDGSDDLYGDSGNDRLYGGMPKPSGSGALDPRFGLGVYSGDRAYGGKGSDWIDPNCVWLYVEQDSKDVKTGATGNPNYPGGGGTIGSGTVVGNYNNGGTGVTSPISFAEDVWHSVFAQSAIFVGASDSTPTTQQLQAATTVPAAVATDATGVKPAVLHVPRSWTLTLTGSTVGGYAWYRVTRADQAFALMQHDAKVLVGQYVSTQNQIGAATLVGVNTRTLIVLDETTDDTDPAKWIAPADWTTPAVVTRSGTRAVLPGVNSVLTFGQMDFSWLPAQPKGTRAIVTLQGLILIDSGGARWSA